MNISFDIESGKGDLIRIALSPYDDDTIKSISDDHKVLSLSFFDISLFRIQGESYLNYKTLYAIADSLANFLLGNPNCVLSFYCDIMTEVKRSHSSVPPQEYRSLLFSKMYEMYIRSKGITNIINHRIVIQDPEDSVHSQFTHFICREEHLPAVLSIEKVLREK